jgi:hypothetical protein
MGHFSGAWLMDNPSERAFIFVYDSGRLTPGVDDGHVNQGGPFLPETVVIRQ